MFPSLQNDWSFCQLVSQFKMGFNNEAMVLTNQEQTSVGVEHGIGPLWVGGVGPWGSWEQDA